ncbi:MAG: hypothetical protein M1827_005930 [Pycnora praestabilis]|nr:MAG: hypothetical protein M1827_005930 [Pycnora praestabilis]
MSDEDEAGYNDSNRAFLQAFLARSVLTLKEAKPILAAIFTVHEGRETLPEDITEADFNSYVAAANHAVSPFDLEIRSTYSQTSVDRTRIFALVNTTSDPITQLATTHSADEISFLKRLLDAMFETYNTPRREVCAITSMQAVQLHKGAPATSVSGRISTGGAETQGSGGQGLTMIQAEKMMKSLVEEGWFDKSKAGFYNLSARALMELRGWLVETYNEDEGEEGERRVKVCFACKEIVTVGQRCSNRDCPCRIHDLCASNFFRVQKAKRCPVCKKDWTGTDYVGERAITTTEKYLQGRRRSGISSQARRNTQVLRQEQEEEQQGQGEDEAAEEAEEEEDGD